jgi:hypothetical protein
VIANVRRFRRPRLRTSAVLELRPAVRRTRAMRLALALAGLALLALCAQLARGLNARPSSYFATGGGGLVVLDLSTSIDRYKYQRIQRVLRSFAETGSRIGLVVFSDSAYEMLPPGTRGDELRPLLPFFELPPRPRTRLEARELVRGGFGLEAPWTGSFRGGTRISTGLREARRVIDSEGIVNPSVLLLSDLDNSGFDTSSLTDEIVRYEREGIELRIVPLFPSAEDRGLFEQLIGPGAFVQRSELLHNTKVEERQTLVGDFPAALAIGALALLALLALNERLCGRVAWRGRQSWRAAR